MNLPNRIKNITGLIYGKLTVIEYVGKNHYGKTSWLCKCECGRPIVVSSNSLQSGKTTSCGCYQREVVLSRFDKNRNDMIGKVFGRLIIDSVDGVRNGTTYYICKCSCGGKTVLPISALVCGNTKSCGCLGIESRIVHGMSDHPLYQVYLNMKARCYNPNTPSFHRYGGREDNPILICDEWLNDFKTFHNWAVNNGYQPGLTIERSDNDKGYNPNNCVWTTMNEQARNRVTTKISLSDARSIATDDRSNNLIASEYNIDASCVSRIKTGDTWRDK